MTREQYGKIIIANRALLNQYAVKSLSIFGSVAKGDAEPGSDVDILVEFEQDARIGLFAFTKLKDELSRILNCPVDLVTPEAIHPALKDGILEEAFNVS